MIELYRLVEGDEGVFTLDTVQPESLSDDELDMYLDYCHETLSNSQNANCYPEQYKDCIKLGKDEHLNLWDKMWRLTKEKDSRKNKVQC